MEPKAEPILMRLSRFDYVHGLTPPRQKTGTVAIALRVWFGRLGGVMVRTLDL